MKILYIGCDVSKKSFEVSFHATDLEKSIGELTNNKNGYAKLRTKANAYVKKGHQIHLVAEPTGTYHLGLINYAHEQEWIVSLPNPSIVRQWAKGQGNRAKTDKIDARMLAAYGFKEEPAPQLPLPEHVEELDIMLRRQIDIEKSIRQERNRLESFNQRKISPQSAHQSILATIAFHQAQLLEIEAAIKLHLKQHPDLAQQRKFLLTVPGIGLKGVLKILVLLYRWDARTSGQGDSNGIVAFVGLDPVSFTSGSSIYRRPSISKMGDGEARSTLFMSSLGGIRAKDSPLVDFYNRLIGKQKPKKVALVAAARKILTWAFGVFRSGLPFDPVKASPKSV